MTRGWNLSVSKCLYRGAKNAFVNGPRWARMRTHCPLAMSHTRALSSSEPFFFFFQCNKWEKIFAIIRIIFVTEFHGICFPHRLVNDSRPLIRSGMWQLSHGPQTFSSTPSRPPFVRHHGEDPINLFCKSFPPENRRNNFLRHGQPQLNATAEMKWYLRIWEIRGTESMQCHTWPNCMLNNVLPVFRSRILHVWSRDTENAKGWISDFVTWRPVTGKEWSDHVESGSHSWRQTKQKNEVNQSVWRNS